MLNFTVSKDLISISIKKIGSNYMIFIIYFKIGKDNNYNVILIYNLTKLRKFISIINNNLSMNNR